MSNHWFGVRPPAGASSAVWPGATSGSQRPQTPWPPAPDPRAAAAETVGDAGAEGQETVGVPAADRSVDGAIPVIAESVAAADREIVGERGREAVADVPGGAGVARPPVARIGKADVGGTAERRAGVG